MPYNRPLLRQQAKTWHVQSRGKPGAARTLAAAPSSTTSCGPLQQLSRPADSRYSARNQAGCGGAPSAAAAAALRASWPPSYAGRRRADSAAYRSSHAAPGTMPSAARPSSQVAKSTGAAALAAAAVAVRKAAAHSRGGGARPSSRSCTTACGVELNNQVCRTMDTTVGLAVCCATKQLQKVRQQKWKARIGASI